MAADTSRSAETGPKATVMGAHPVLAAWRAGLDDRASIMRVSPGHASRTLGEPLPGLEGPFGRIDLVGLLLGDADHKALLQSAAGQLQDGGLLMIAGLGPGTLPGLRRGLAWTPEAVTAWWSDMHDLGDLLVQVGLADPVLESERLSLAYRDWRLAWRDLRTFPWRPPRQAWAHVSRAAWKELLQSQKGPDGRIVLELELVYAHAWRVPARRRPDPETPAPVQFVPRNRFSSG
jgi:hypothetical protein